MGAKRLRWVDQVLKFWFNELEPADWFRVNSAVDDTIRQRFSDLHGELSETPLETCLRSADDVLASILVLDQFSRNIFRNSARAFKTDQQALTIANEAIARHIDQDVAHGRRQFVYLPFEHSENITDQDRAVELMATLGSETLDRYAKAHREIIAEFGRFPHRNAVLGRPSTAAETAYLAKPGSGF